MTQKFLKCESDRCEVLADDFFSHAGGKDHKSRFNNVLADIVRVYPDAVLIGAIAAAKYIRPPVEPRMTYDVDILLSETDFERFLADDMPPETLNRLETYFGDSDSAMHSVKHKQTGIYVDFLSAQSKPVKKKLIRYILNHRAETSHLLKVGDSTVDIIKPEILIALKLNRYHKNPKTEKGLSDRLDIIKILKTFHAQCLSLDNSLIESFVSQAEFRRFEHLAADVDDEMTCEATNP
jgi:hypothetical protein